MASYWCCTFPKRKYFHCYIYFFFILSFTFYFVYLQISCVLENLPQAVCIFLCFVLKSDKSCLQKRFAAFLHFVPLVYWKWTKHDLKSNVQPWFLVSRFTLFDWTFWFWLHLNWNVIWTKKSQNPTNILPEKTNVYREWSFRNRRQLIFCYPSCRLQNEKQIWGITEKYVESFNKSWCLILKTTFAFKPGSERSIGGQPKNNFS